MTQKYHYHSALSSATDAAPVYRLPIGSSIAFQHDVFEPLPEDYDRVEAFFSEPPWPSGFHKFNDRAGVEDGRQYQQMVHRIHDIINTGKPVIMMCGKTMLKWLPQPDEHRDGSIGSIKTVPIFAWNCTIPEGATDHAEVVASMARRYSCIGDPFCGYGATARICMAEGADFVVSDFDPRCIGRMALEAKKWNR